jgi:signal transduction histidine kinase
VREVGEIDGRPFLVMELVRGETLADRLAGRALPQEEVLALAGKLADTLAAVHGAELVHRDVKPRNVVLEPSGNVRLVDFGFAAPIDPNLRPHDGSGTPAYAAPEQFDMPARVDARSDLYSLGRVLFEACVGWLPGNGPDARSPAPSVAEELEAASVRADLATILTGLLAPAARDRYPDASALLADLRLATRNLPVAGASGYAPNEQQGVSVVRSAELRKLTEAAQDLAAGSGRLALIEGPRGAGKSRIMTSVAAALRTGGGVRCVEVRCREGQPPLTALRALLDGYVAVAKRARPTERAAIESALRAALRDELAPVAVLAAPCLAEYAMTRAPQRTLGSGSMPEAAAELLVRLARGGGPLLVLVDDMQWIDPVSRDALVRAAYRIREAPLMIVLARRVGGARPQANAALDAEMQRLRELDQSRVLAIDLGPLSREQIGALVRGHLGADASDPDLARRVAVLADDTPLGVLEVLGAMLDDGGLRPHGGEWVVDESRVERAELPRQSLALLGRRIAQLPPATQHVLEAAALLGTEFEDQLLADVLMLARSDVDYALADAERAGVVGAPDSQRHRFVHDSLRERLREQLGEADQRRLHQTAAEALDARGVGTLDALYSTALHYAAGEREKSPARLQAVARKAGEAALARFDNETALRFFDLARDAASSGEIRLDAAFHRDVGEAHLRLGGFDDARSAFELALTLAADAAERATLHGRIAWVDEATSAPDAAWASLGRAFEALGVRMPVESATSAFDTATQFARRGVRDVIDRVTRHASPAHVVENAELLCQLHYQNARLGVEYAKPFRIVQSTLRARELSEPLPPSRAQVRAKAHYGLVLTALGRHEAGKAELARALDLAADLGDPPTSAFTAQARSTGACWASDFDDALVLTRECLDVYGPWLEIGELCLGAANADLIESLRGRPLRSWAWLERPIERVRRSGRSNAVFDESISHRVRATLAALGRTPNTDAWLQRALHDSASRALEHRGFLGMVSWGAKARVFVEALDLGAEFDALVAEFERQHLPPRQAYPFVVEYYVAIAHARIHQALIAPRESRRGPAAALRRASSDLSTAAKMPLFKAHALLAEGTLAWLEGDASKSKRRLAEAESVAQQETCSWVLSSVARVRAHMLREAGRADAAIEQARIADLLAREQGAVVRARAVREDFALPDTSASATSSRGSSAHSSSRRRQLTTLIQVVREPKPDSTIGDHAVSVLEELLRDFRAERAHVLFRRGTEHEDPLMVSRARLGVAPAPAASWRHMLMRAVSDSGEAWPPDEIDLATRGVPHGVDLSRTLVVPLRLYDRPVGAVSLERAATDPTFTREDREILVMLAYQVAVGLELAHLVAEREELQSSLARAQKMEAVGQLAGGVAHDFNNLLAAIRGTAEFVQEIATDDEVTKEMNVISQATERAAALTRQLLEFSRHRSSALVPVDLSHALRELVPVLRGVARGHIRFDVSTTDGLLAETDRSGFDQAVLNLSLNARDAMPNGGVVKVEAEAVVLEEPALRRGAPSVGPYVRIEVRDAGVGIPPELIDRVFEPFFTTKPMGRGTGLGLATVYAYAKNSGGYVEISSAVGRGTTVSLFLPRTDREIVKEPVAAPRPTVAPGGHTILVVDDEPMLARSTQRILERKGYRVVVASGGAEALEIAEARRSELTAAVIDMLMPGMGGAELWRRMKDAQIPAKVLFVSGFSPEDGSDIDPEMFLQKPFSGDQLVAKLRGLLDR